MPELYGQPYKWQLRNQISELQQEKWNLLKETRELSSSLKLQRAKADALEARLTRIKGVLGSAISDVDADISDDVIGRLMKRAQTG